MTSDKNNDVLDFKWTEGTSGHEVWQECFSTIKKKKITGDVKSIHGYDVNLSSVRIAVCIGWVSRMPHCRALCPYLHKHCFVPQTVERTQKDCSTENPPAHQCSHRKGRACAPTPSSTCVKLRHTHTSQAMRLLYKTFAREIATPLLAA